MRSGAVKIVHRYVNVSMSNLPRICAHQSKGCRTYVPQEGALPPISGHCSVRIPALFSLRVYECGCHWCIVGCFVHGSFMCLMCSIAHSAHTHTHTNTMRTAKTRTGQEKQ